MKLFSIFHIFFVEILTMRGGYDEVNDEWVGENFIQFTISIFIS